MQIASKDRLQQDEWTSVVNVLACHSYVVPWTFLKKFLTLQGLGHDVCQVATWKVFGKPNPEPYLLAANVIAEQAESLGWNVSSSGRPEYNIFMIGGEVS